MVRWCYVSIVKSLGVNAKGYESHFRSAPTLKEKKKNGKIDGLIDESRKCSTEECSAGN